MPAPKERDTNVYTRTTCKPVTPHGSYIGLRPVRLVTGRPEPCIHRGCARPSDPTADAARGAVAEAGPVSPAATSALFIVFPLKLVR